MNRFVALSLYISFFATTTYPMAVAVQKQQQYTYAQRVHKVATFYDHIVQCAKTFATIRMPYTAENSALSNDILQQDISLIMLALFFSSNYNDVLYAKACLNALYYQPANDEYSAFQKTQPLVVENLCQQDGKLSLERNKFLQQSIYNSLQKSLPLSLQTNLHKLWKLASQMQTIKMLPEWLQDWNLVLIHMHEHLSQKEQRFPDLVKTAREHQYNKNLYELFNLCDKQEFEKAAEIAINYKNEPLFKKVFYFYYHCSDDFKAKVQKTGLPPVSPLEKLEATLHVRQREHARTKTLHDPRPYTKEYPLSPATQNYLFKSSLQPQPFQQCYGNHSQQQVHKEITKIHEQTGALEEETNDDPEIKKITNHIPHFTNLAREYNEHGLIDDAYSILDFCHALLDCAFSIATGIGKGVVQGFGNYMHYALNNPLEFLVRPLIGNFLCAIRLASLTGRLLNIGSIGLKSMTGSQEALDQWETIRTNMERIKNGLLAKFNSMTLEQYAQETTALATQFILDYQCAHLLADIYQSALADMSTPKSSLAASSAQASTILAGNGNYLLEQLIYYSGNSIGSSLEQILHAQIQNIVPSDETIYYVAHNKHIPQRGSSWTDILAQTQTEPAQFKPSINLLRLQKNAWLDGLEVAPGNSWHIFRDKKIIGAVGGNTTHYLKVKKVGNILHGQPISRQEYTKLKNFMG